MENNEVALRQKEYQRFGPWVTKVSEDDPVPPLFAPYVEDRDRVVMSFKIPRDIELRKATPSMDLYDFLVSVYDEQLVIHRRSGSKVSTRRLRYNEIQMIHLVEILLDGRLQLITAHNRVELPFNSVSKVQIDELVTEIRKRYLKNTGHPSAKVVKTNVTRGMSFFYQRLQRTFEADHPNFVLCAAQSDTAIGHAETSLIRRALFGIIGRSVNESLHYSDGQELIVAHHGRPFRSLRRSFAQHTTYLPVVRLGAVTWEEESSNNAIVLLTLGTGFENVTLGFTKDNPDRHSYALFLSQALLSNGGVGEASFGN